MLDERITEDEIEFMQCFVDPICNSECLFNNFDNPTEFDPDKFGYIRLGQLPLLSYEYLVDENPKLTPKENFKLKEGSGNVFCFGGRNFGKCSYINDLCLLADGRRVKFGDLTGTTQNIISLNQETLKLEETEASFSNNGEKECLKFKLKSGKKITITENHPLLTDRGWVIAENLKVDDWVATPRNYVELGSTEVDPNIAKLLGYLLGDGGCSQATISFTNINSEIIEEYKEIADYFNCSINKNGITYNVKKKKYITSEYIKGVGYIKGEGNSKNNIAKLVLKYGINKLAKHKTIPKEVFTWKNKYIALLLNRLYACDGHVSKLNNTVELTFASREMIYQVQHLLLRFGIHSYIYEKNIKQEEKTFYAWRLFIGKDFDKFISKIGIISKDKVKPQNSSFSTSDLIPKKFIENIYNEFTHKKELSLRKLKVYNPSRRKCQDINKVINNEKLGKIVNSDIYWDKIKKIANVGKLPTVAVEVPKNQNYIANDIISHNTMVVEKLDIVLSLLLNDGWDMIITSFDEIHISGVMDWVRDSFDSHPFLKDFKVSIKQKPYLIRTKNNASVLGVNMALSSKNPGSAFYQKHSKKIWVEEASAETDEVYKKRIGSKHEIGMIERISGMTDFTRYSPAGQKFYDLELKPRVINLPQFINPNFGEKEKKEEIKKYNGEATVEFKIYVNGEICESGVSFFDMDRVKKCYNEDKEIKNFEITKNNFDDFKDIIVAERPKNCEEFYIASDIGDGGSPSEVIILAKINEKYHYIYSISLYNLIDEQQYDVFKWLGEELKANFIGLDCSDGAGRSIFRRLEKVFPKENLTYVAFTEKIDVDLKLDDNGNPEFDNDGKELYVKEYVSEWSVKHLRDLFYDERMMLPLDYSFDQQVNRVVKISTANRTVYKCLAPKNHLFQAFQVFAISQWQNEFSGTSSIKAKVFNKSGV